MPVEVHSSEGLGRIRWRKQAVPTDLAMLGEGLEEHDGPLLRNRGRRPKERLKFPAN